MTGFAAPDNKSGFLLMSFSYDAFKGNFSIKDFISDIRYKKEFRKSHPTYFDPDGLLLYCGGQGMGKTLSAVRYVNRLNKLYPKAIIVSNIALHLENNPEIIPYTCLADVAAMDNGYEGIILLLDEIQVEFNSLESAKIHPSVIQTISQQRKRRLHVVGTTQLFKRLAKPWREQCNSVVDCSCVLNHIQRNQLIDFGTIAEDANGNLTQYEYSQQTFWFRSPKHYQMYDTFERVKRVGGGK